jgi:uncharacterized sulfatase
MKKCIFTLCFLFLVVSTASAAERPNILFFFVDDLGKYASIYADPGKPSLNDVIRTPHFDRVGREGVVFNNAFVPVASCGPCRASLATGRYFWNCGSGAFLNGKASDWRGTSNPMKTLPKFVDLLRESGYHAWRSRKTFAFTSSRQSPPMRKLETVEYQRYGLYVGTAADDKERAKRHAQTLAHPRLEMRKVLADDSGKPFFFVYGSINVHRPFTPDSGRKLWGIQPDQLKGLIPKFLPDVEDVRRDFSDYLGEVMAADAMLGVMLDELEKAGELNNTLVIVSGDHGIPGVPRGKTNCYDLATRVPLLVRWPGGIQAGRWVDDFVSVMDIGPTLLELANVKEVPPMDGRSFLKQLTARKSGWVDPQRNTVIIGRELHFHSARDGNLPYPMRAIRTPEYLYIRNFKPDRWPMGAPYNLDNADAKGEYKRLEHAPFRDLDASLTKKWLLENRGNSRGQAAYELTLGKRPAEEFFAINKDVDQLRNFAKAPQHAKAKSHLAARLMKVLKDANDPRLRDAFDGPPWVSPTASEANPRKGSKKK